MDSATGRLILNRDISQTDLDSLGDLDFEVTASDGAAHSVRRTSKAKVKAVWGRDRPGTSFERQV